MEPHLGFYMFTIDYIFMYLPQETKTRQNRKKLTITSFMYPLPVFCPSIPPSNALFCCLFYILYCAHTYIHLLVWAYKLESWIFIGRRPHFFFLDWVTSFVYILKSTSFSENIFYFKYLIFFVHIKKCNHTRGTREHTSSWLSHP